MKSTPDPAITTLLLAAHGSSRPGGHNPVRQLTERLKAKHLFADVRCGFLKEPPLLGDVLSEITAPELTVIPMLTGHGYITDELIPEALLAVNNSTTVHLCNPLGTAQPIADVMAQRARLVINKQNLNPDQVSILITAHGNAANPENARQTKALAARIEGLLGDIMTKAAFIEEAPLISGWPQWTQTENLIVLPFLIGGGMHGAEDVPVMLGIDDKNHPFVLRDNDAPFIGPLKAHGHSIWLCQALGYEDALVDVIIGLAQQQLKING